MSLLVAGLVLFLGIHLLPTVPAWRDALHARLGDKPYRGVFSLVSLAGLVLIVIGYMRADPTVRMFDPVPAARAIAPEAVTLALILFAASHMRAHLRKWVQHPMVVGVILWSAVHLLANGELRATVLFGSFLAWAIVDYVSALARGATKPFVPVVRQDVMAIVGGTAVALVLMAVHRPLFGVPVVGFGL